MQGFRNTPRLYNRRTLKCDVPNSASIGRDSPFGNPFHIGKDGTRDEVCDRFEKWIMKPEQKALCKRAKEELRGKHLICWCFPLRCHGLTWLRIANK